MPERRIKVVRLDDDILAERFSVSKPAEQKKALQVPDNYDPPWLCSEPSPDSQGEIEFAIYLLRALSAFLDDPRYRERALQIEGYLQRAILGLDVAKLEEIEDEILAWNC